jgi:hypothetical protein
MHVQGARRVVLLVVTGCLTRVRRRRPRAPPSCERHSRLSPPLLLLPPRTSPSSRQSSALSCRRCSRGRAAEFDDYLRRRTNIAQWVPCGGFGRHGEPAAANEALARALHAGNPAAAAADRQSYTARVARDAATSGACTPFADLQDLAEAAALNRGDLEALAAAGACAALAGNRHQAFWQVAGTEVALPLAPPGTDRTLPLLLQPTEGEGVIADYRSLGLTLGRHPLALLRPHWPPGRAGMPPMVTAGTLAGLPDGARVRVAGLVVTRQKPATASGVTFVTLEDDTGNINLIVWKRVGEAQRAALLRSRLLEVGGRLQREGEVTHVIAERLTDRSRLLGALRVQSRDFR